MPRPHFHPTPSLFPWMSLPSIPIFLIKMASRHAKKFGRKEKSRTHLHRLWSNFWPSYSNATTLSSTGNAAMGTKMAPAYANIFMGRLEGQLLKLMALRPFSWLRFIGDIDMKWSHGRKTLSTFLDDANNFHPSIKFTAGISTKQQFLDTKSSLVGNTISVDLYTKPTDTHQYLLPTSCHPKHCCKNVPYSLALRLRRVCSESDTFESRARELTEHLRKRGYQKQEISLAIERARQQKRENLLSYRPKSESSVLPFVLTYHPDLPKVRYIVNKRWPTIESSSTLSEIFTERPTMAYRRPKSVGSSRTC